MDNDLNMRAKTIEHLNDNIRTVKQFNVQLQIEKKTNFNDNLGEIFCNVRIGNDL